MSCRMWVKARGQCEKFMWVPGMQLSHQTWWQGPSVCVLANFVCQFDCIWNHLKLKLQGTVVKDFCNWIIWSRKTYAKSGPLMYKGEENFDFCLLALTLAGKWSTPFLWLIVKSTSSGSQHRLKSRGSPGILQDSSASLEQQETCTLRDWSTSRPFHHAATTVVLHTWYKST